MTQKHEAFSELTQAIYGALAAGLTGKQVQDHVRNILETAGELPK